MPVHATILAYHTCDVMKTSSGDQLSLIDWKLVRSHRNADDHG